jgi:O-antigen/teichoic acid export membrane protein
MALVLMANTLAVNTPRYALAHWAGDAELGYFASIAYLIVALNLVTTAINNTILPRFAVYHMTDTKKFIRLMTVGLAFIWGIGLLAVLVTIFAGPLILRFLYTPAYSSYAPLLVLMMIVGCMLNSSALFGTAVTAAQSYWPQTLNALLFLAVAAGASVILVPRSGVYGAAEALLLASAVQMLAFAMTTIRMCRRMPANGQASKEPISEPAAQ